jgi:hypothetical protein
VIDGEEVNLRGGNRSHTVNELHGQRLSACKNLTDHPISVLWRAADCGRWGVRVDVEVIARFANGVYLLNRGRTGRLFEHVFNGLLCRLLSDCPVVVVTGFRFCPERVGERGKGEESSGLPPLKLRSRN